MNKFKKLIANLQLFFSGIQLLILGLIGEYVGKISLTNNQSPQYVIRQILTNEVNDINE